MTCSTPLLVAERAPVKAAELVVQHTGEVALEDARPGRNDLGGREGHPFEIRRRRRPRGRQARTSPRSRQGGIRDPELDGVADDGRRRLRDLELDALVAEESRGSEVGREGELIARRSDVAGQSEVRFVGVRGHGDRTLAVPRPLTCYGHGSCRSLPPLSVRVGDGSRRAAAAEVVCIGHAIVDRLAHVDEDTIEAAGVEPGAMTLVDGARIAAIAELVDGLAPSRRRVGRQHGRRRRLARRAARLRGLGRAGLARRRLRARPRGAGCALRAEPEPSSVATGQCLVLVTADSRRTMATSLGAGVAIDVEDGRARRRRAASVLYLEGYLLDSPGTYAARRTCRRAGEVGRGAGGAQLVGPVSRRAATARC